MPERTSRKIGAWVSPDLYDKLQSLGYLGGRVTQTDTIIRALELLVRETEGELLGDKRETLGDIPQVGEVGAELGELRAILAGKEELIKEKDKRINDLTREIEGLTQYKQDMSSIANYFKSIETKQIEAPKRPWWKIWK